MEKLIELLNEYEIWKTKDKVSQNPKRSRREWYKGPLGSIFGTLMNERESRLSIISKSYGFIKRLVDNDKIDLYKAYLENCCMCGGYIRYGEVNGLIMKLSISDNPISDLISYLK